ncbi:MAG: hypothetical protein RLZZ490_1515, partial [Cyanobacteriota bacterium]
MTTLSLNTPQNQTVWTDEAFMRLSEDEQRHELVNGGIVKMGNSGALHG